MIDKLKSRKLWVMVVMAIVGILNTQLGDPIPTDTVAWISNMAMIYLVGQSAVDTAKEVKKEKG